MFYLLKKFEIILSIGGGSEKKDTAAQATPHCPVDRRAHSLLVAGVVERVVQRP